MPPKAIRTRPPAVPPPSPLVALAYEHLDEVALCADAFEREDWLLHDSEAKLLLFATLRGAAGSVGAPPPSPARRFRLPAVLGRSHSSGSQMSAMDRLPSLRLALFGK